MKIAHVLWEFPPMIRGGLGTFGLEIAQRQVAMKNDVTVFSLNDENKLNTSDTWKGVKVYRPKLLDLTPIFRLSANQELRSWGQNFKFFSDVVSYNFLSASQLVKLFSDNGGKSFDIIDGHDWLGIMGGIVAKKELNLPLVFHVHSTETGRSVGFGSQTIRDIEFEGGQVADRIITVSYAMKDELEKLGFPSSKIRVCWNGIDPKKYNPSRISEKSKKNLREKYGIKDDEIMLFFIGRLVTVKGADKLVEAMPSVLKEYPKTKLVLLGIGDMEKDLNNRIKELGIQKNVIIRNEFVDEDERILHYAASDIVVLPSLYEPFGIVCTEAMSMAKPVVVGARGTNGFREQIIPDGDQQCGVHINPFDPEDISWGIKQILAMEDKGIQLGKHGRQRAMDVFGWDAVAKRTFDIYKEIVK